MAKFFATPQSARIRPSMRILCQNKMRAAETFKKSCLGAGLYSPMVFLAFIQKFANVCR